MTEDEQSFYYNPDMLQTIKMPMNLMNLTDYLPKPAYALECRPRTKQQSRQKNKSYAKLSRVEKFAKTKYKKSFSKAIKSENELPLRLRNSRGKSKHILAKKVRTRESLPRKTRPTQTSSRPS